MSNEFASAGLTAGQLNAGVKIIGGHDAFLSLLRGELVVTKVAAAVTQAAALKPDRITFTVVGTGLSGAEWLARLEAGGHKVSDWARDILSRPDYDASHRLEAGKVYTLALVRGSEISKVSNRTTSALQAIGVRDYGPQAVVGLKGELALLICEKFTNEELKKMGLEYIAVLHTPLVVSNGNPSVLSVNRDDGDSWVSASYGYSRNRWYDEGAFPVLVE